MCAPIPTAGAGVSCTAAELGPPRVLGAEAPAGALAAALAAFVSIGAGKAADELELLLEAEPRMNKLLSLSRA